MTPKKRVLLIVNLHKNNTRLLADEIREKLTERGFFVSIFSFEGKPGPIDGGDYDIAFSLGGDGTVLYTARVMAPLGIPIMPINVGTLGFIAAVHPEEWGDVFDHWEAGNASISERLMLDVSVERNGQSVIRTACLNDVVVSASGIAKLIRLNVESSHIRLGHYRSDGLIVATPTGSTAYSVAAGGPIVDPEMDAVIINPICPFTLSNRPVVMPADETISIEIEAEQRSSVLLTVDGQVDEPLEPRDRVQIRKAAYRARIIASDRRVFYKVLRSKLNWSGGPDA